MAQDERSARQRKQLERFESAVQEGKGQDHIKKVSEQVKEKIADLEASKIKGVPITEFPEYEKYLQTFLHLNEKFVDLKNLLPVYDIDMDEATRKIQERKMTKEELLNKLMEWTKDPKKIEEVSKVLSFGREELNALKRGLRDYNAVQSDLCNQTNPVVIRYLLLNLHKDAVEIYLKTLKEIHIKAEKTDEFRGKKLHEFYEPYGLSENENYLLRLDTAHLNYTTRDRYTNEKLIELTNDLLTKIAIILLAKQKFLFSHLERQEKHGFLGSFMETDL